MLAKAPPRTQRGASIPAPVGMNLVDNAGGLPPGDAVEIVNMIRSQYGLRSRSGYREWVTELGDDVRTLLGFQGSTGTEDRLFACLQDGIYDATATTATPSSVYTFGTADADSGKTIGAAFTTLAGAHYLLVCDETNGYLHYNESGDVWTKPVAGVGAGEINGADPDDFVFVMVWKKRVWFVRRGSSAACYLPADQITGTVADFDFGPQFKHGGVLVGLWNWTKDGTDSVDDYLVAVSSSGDVVIYQGIDPTVYTSISLVGTRYVGSIPAGRHVASDFGGEVVLLTSLGLLPASKLFAGVIAPDAYVSQKISPVLGQELTDRGTDYGWDMRIHPEDKTLVIVTPDDGAAEGREQWALSLTGQGWSQHVGVPMNCVESWKGKLYFGTEDGRVCINDGDVDNNQLAGSSNSTAIEWSLLTAFSDMGIPQLKRPSMAKPTFMTDGTAPQYTIEARYDYDRTDVGAISFVAGATGAVWDTAIWDSSVWGSGVGTAGRWRGLAGMGNFVAIALKGSSQARSTLTGIEVTYTVAGRPL